VNCWLETTHWRRLESNSVHNEEMVPEQTTRRRCRTLHHQIACTLNQVSLGYIEHSFWWDHITRLSNADKKNRPGRSQTICRRFAELSDLRESKWDSEISWKIPPRYWNVFSKNRSNFRKESFSPNLIDNQSPLYITKFQLLISTEQNTSGKVVARTASNTKVVGSTLGDGVGSHCTYAVVDFLLSKLHISKMMIFENLNQRWGFLLGFELRTFKVPG